MTLMEFWNRLTVGGLAGWASFAALGRNGGGILHKQVRHGESPWRSFVELARGGREAAQKKGRQSVQTASPEVQVFSGSSR